MYSKTSRVICIILIVLILAVSGCGTKQTIVTAKTIKMAGSGTINNIAKELAKAYIEKNRDVKIEANQTTSSDGIKAAGDGSIDIGMTSRALNDEEKKKGLIEHVIAYDAVAVIVSKSNIVTELSIAQLKDIYTGKIKNWKEVGGIDAPIKIGTRTEGMGSRSVFDDVLKIDKEADSAEAIEKNEDVLPYVQKDANAIAYISMGWLDNSVTILKVGGAIPSVNAVKSREYKLSRNLYLVTKSEMKPEVEEFIDFILTDSGQKVVFDQGYITMRKSRK